ncbi:MAG: hypothetical protein IJU23_15120 [Proteobacteria bacterium]|nr:hypothetical protein [Pseudomonadota bacterium]
MKLSVLLAAASLFFFGCQKKEIPEIKSPDSQNQNQGNRDVHVEWHDVLNYSYVDSDSKEGKRALKTAKKSRSYKNYYAEFMVGNLVVIKGTTPPSRFVLDGETDIGYMAVLLGDEPELVNIPKRSLLSQFLAAIRPDPEKMKLEQRLRVISRLGGFEMPQYKKDLQHHYLLKQLGIEPRDPTWIDEDGKLSISYYAYRPRGGMMAEELVQCQIDVDAEQNAEESCRSMEEPEEAPEESVPEGE